MVIWIFEELLFSSFQFFLVDGFKEISIIVEVFKIFWSLKFWGYFYHIKYFHGIFGYFRTYDERILIIIKVLGEGLSVFQSSWKRWEHFESIFVTSTIRSFQ